MQEMWQEVGRMTDLIYYSIGLIGVWILADAVASLWAYTGNSDRAKGQSFWRDHLIRIIRGVLGIILVWLGYVLL